MANWRTAFKSDFLASWDIDSTIQLTISHVEVKEVQLQKKEKKVVAYFVEKTFANGEEIKPMILNATNCKLLNSYTGTKETNDWKNITVEIGVKENKGRIGEANGLAILRVLKGQIDLLETIINLRSSATKEITLEQNNSLDDIIEKKKSELYNKTINFLKSMQ